MVRCSGPSGIDLVADPAAPATVSAAPSNGQLRPPPPSRLITELPPPSQLDIEWSPVLTKSNERILKLGNLVVTSSAGPHSPNGKSGDGDTPKKFSRFFGGNTTKKRQRLVMITSSARIVMAAAGGDEKKTKMEIDLLSGGTTWKSFQDSKGLTCWCVDMVSLGLCLPHVLFTNAILA
jgi:3-phosphoinositide dependent protein kinase-1